MRIKVIKVNAILVALLFGLVTLNKEYLRPLISDNWFLQVLCGSVPNFLAAYLISLAVVSAVLIRNIKKGRLFVYIASLLVFCILAVEEIKPMWGASSFYDPYDIIASGGGSLLAILSYELIVFILRRRQSQTPEKN